MRLHQRAFTYKAGILLLVNMHTPSPSQGWGFGHQARVLLYFLATCVFSCVAYFLPLFVFVPDCPEAVDQVGLKLIACLTFQTAVTEGMCHHLALKRFFWGMVVVLYVELGILGKHFTPDLHRLSLLFFPSPFICVLKRCLCAILASVHLLMALNSLILLPILTSVVLVLQVFTTMLSLCSTRN